MITKSDNAKGLIISKTHFVKILIIIIIITIIIIIIIIITIITIIIIIIIILSLSSPLLGLFSDNETKTLNVT